MTAVTEVLMKNRLLILERGVDKNHIGQVALTLMHAGIRAFEVTFRPGSDQEIRNAREEISTAVRAAGSGMMIGAGTVLNTDHVHAACDAGAQFIVSPGMDEDVIRESKRLGLTVVPGALTPSEIMRAWTLGADIVKLFPADDMGMHYIRNLRGPLPHIPLMATGGVNPNTIPEFLNAGINVVGTGATVVRPDLVKAENYEEIGRLAGLHIQAVKNADVPYCL